MPLVKLWGVICIVKMVVLKVVKMAAKAVKVGVIPIVLFHVIRHVKRLVPMIAIKVAREEMKLIENSLLSV